MSKELVKYSRFQNYSNVVDILEVFEENKQKTLKEIDSILNRYNGYCNLVQGLDFSTLFYDFCLQLVEKM